MNRLENGLKHYTDEQLLYELIQRNGLQKAPKHSEWYGDGWMVCTVGIGTDSSTSIVIDDGDMCILAKSGLLK